MMSKKGSMHRFFNWYIKGEYHCDKCPYSWEEGTSYEYDDCDCGCFIKGDIRDTCRLLPPFRWIIGYPKRKKERYYKNHQYDGFVEYAIEDDENDKKFQELLIDFLNSKNLYCKDRKGNYIPYSESDLSYFYMDAWKLRKDYEDFLWEQEQSKNPPENLWKKAFLNTWNNITKHIKPYFCK